MRLSKVFQRPTTANGVEMLLLKAKRGSGLRDATWMVPTSNEEDMTKMRTGAIAWTNR